MNDQDKSKEQLISELRELRLAHNSLQSTIEADLLSHRLTVEALRESEEQFQLLFNKAPLGYQSLDIDGYFMEVNQQWLDTLGYQREEVIGKWFGDFLTPGYQDGFRKRFPVFKAQGHIHSEFEMIHKNGSLLFIAFDGKIGYDLRGNFKQTHCILQDITENKHAEKALKESEKKYRLLYENAGIGIGYYKLDGTIISFNNIAAQNMNGVPEDFVGKSLFDLFPKPEAEFFYNRMKRVVDSEIPVEYEDKVRLQNVDKYYLSTYARVVNTNGEIEGVQILSLDITQRKQAEESAIKIGQHYQALIEKAPDGIALIDAAGNFQYVSPAAKKMFGYLPTDDLLGNPAEYTHPDDLQMVLSELGKIFEEPSYFPTLEYRFKDKLGQWHWVETTFSNLLANPSVASIVLNFHDITERKSMEDAQAFLLQISNPGSDENFFESLAKYLAQCLDMQYVCIDLLEGDRLTAKTLAIYNEGNFDPNVSYALKDTPCGEVVGNHICCYPQKVRSLFPNDPALEDIKAESYIGTTLWSFDGRPIGLIAVIGQHPLQNEELAASMLKLVSLRAAGKLEAMLAEEKVKESEEKFRVLIESTSVAIYLTDLNGKCTYVNPKWCEMAQISYDQAMGDGWINGIYEEDREKVFDNWMRMVDADVSWSCEYRFGTPENISWVYGTAKSYKNDSGQIAGFIGSNVDITKRKLSEAIIQDIIEKNPMSIQILDMEGYPIQANSAHTKLFGVKTPADYSVLQDQQLLSLGFGKLFERIKKGEVVYFPDSYYNVHDVDPSFPNSPTWVKALGFTLNDNNGNPTKMVLMHENITERKNAEALLNDILENNPMSIQIVDKEGFTLRGNPAFVELFGSIPPPEFSIFDDLKNKSSELENLVSRVKNGEIVHLPDIHFNAHDAIAEAPDVPRWIRALIFPLKNSAGKPEQFVFMHENITDRKLAEQELIKAKDRAEESDRLKSAFLANMSHEIRTPMNGILGFSELLKEPGLTGDQQQEYISIIEKSGVRMLNIINNIIDISKIEAGLVKLYIKESNINEQFEYIYTFFKPEVEAKDLKLFFNNNLKAIIQTDTEKLYAILTNLVKNAIKYTKEGFIEFGYQHVVETGHALSLQQKSFLQFYVKDTGIGIPIERQSAIFERFIQADISDKMAYQGAGLGLAITKAYVEMLGGKIWVESEVGKGSTFYFTLPYQAEPDNQQVTRTTISSQNAGNQENPQVSGLNIVIAEDDETSEKLISIALKSFAKKIIKAKTGIEAVEICRNSPDIDLVLMDIQLPGLNGYEATKQIRQFNKNIIIIAQTAFGMSGDREKAIESGCNAYLAKPINKNELLALLHKYFGS